MVRHRPNRPLAFFSNDNGIGDDSGDRATLVKMGTVATVATVAAVLTLTTVVTVVTDEWLLW